jgi:hypothetical protein
MKEKIMLIAGCSHAAGSEIDGNEDSRYNRDHSFGNLLSKKLNRKPINIASMGATNSTISRSVLEWFEKKYDSSNMDIFVLVSWSECTRLESPANSRFFYNMANHKADWNSESELDYLRINLGYEGTIDDDRKKIKEYQKFICKNLTFTEILSLNLILQIQYFLKSKEIDYLMCSSMPLFENQNKHISVYLNLIDNTRYIDLYEPNNSFYWHYRNLGFSNPKAKYWHHNEQPHNLYAEKLFNFLN